jgi:hypothetical protein
VSAAQLAEHAFKFYSMTTIFDDFDDDIIMPDPHVIKSLCRGCPHMPLYKLRGNPSSFCHIITKAFTFSDCRDSLDMAQALHLLLDSHIISWGSLRKLSYFIWWLRKRLKRNKVRRERREDKATAKRAEMRLFLASSFKTVWYSMYFQYCWINCRSQWLLSMTTDRRGKWLLSTKNSPTWSHIWLGTVTQSLNRPDNYYVNWALYVSGAMTSTSNFLSRLEFCNVYFQIIFHFHVFVGVLYSLLQLVVFGI